MDTPTNPEREEAVDAASRTPDEVPGRGPRIYVRLDGVGDSERIPGKVFKVESCEDHRAGLEAVRRISFSRR